MNIRERVKNILLQPAREWPVIERERETVINLYTSYIVPLAAIGPVASIIGLSVIGISLPVGGNYRLPLTSAIWHAVTALLLALVGVYVLALIIDALAPNFLAKKNTLQALKIAAYSSTPGWLAGVFSLIPSLAFLQIFGLYGVYLLYLGLPVLMKVPQEKAWAYAGVIIVVAMIIFALIGSISGCFLHRP
jgi:hypothetical protein